MGLSGRDIDLCRYSAYGVGDSVLFKMDKEEINQRDGSLIEKVAQIYINSFVQLFWLL